MATISEALEVVVKADSSPFNSVMNDLPKTAGQAVKKIEASIIGMGKVMAKTAAAATAAMGGIFVYSLKKSAEAEAAFANLAGLFREPISALGEYKASITELSKATGINAVESTRAYYQAISAGFRSVDDAKAIVTAAAKAAIGGGVATETAVDAITRVLSAYNMTGAQAEHVSDLLFETVNRGVTTFPQLAAGIGDVAGLAAKAKIELADLLSTVATMTKTMSTEKVMTSINGIIASFIRPTDAAKAAAAEYGIILDTMALANGQFGKTMQALSALTAEEFARIFPNVEALKGALAATGAGAKELMENIRAMEGAGGATANAYEKQWGTLSET